MSVAPAPTRLPAPSLDDHDRRGDVSDDSLGAPALPVILARAWVGRAPIARARLGRVFRLDPYALEVLIDDARRLGSGARLDLVMSRITPVGVLEAVRGRLAGLRRRGVEVRVRVERRRRAPAPAGAGRFVSPG